MDYSRMNINPDGGVFTRSRRGTPFSSYIYGTPEENIRKSAILKAYEAIDPSMGKRISALTNDVSIGRLEPFMQKTRGKDSTAVAADLYIKEMMDMGYTEDPNEEKGWPGLRNTYTRARR